MEQYAADPNIIFLSTPDNSVLANIRLPHSNLMAPDEMKNLGYAEDNRPLDEQNQARDPNTGSVAATRSQIS